MALKKVSQIADLDRNNWIVVPYEFTKGEYSLEMSSSRLSSNSIVREVGKKVLNLNLENTAVDTLGRQFIGQIYYPKLLMTILSLGCKVPNFKEEVDYLKLLYLASQEKVDVYNVSGKRVDSKLCEQYFLDIVGLKSPSRGEWVEDRFTSKDTKDNKLRILNDYTMLNDEREMDFQNSEILDENTLMENKTPGISLKDFLLKNHTSQGLPNKNVESGDLYYGHPQSSRHGWFLAFDDQVGFNGYARISQKNSNLGVRPCRKIIDK